VVRYLAELAFPSDWQLESHVHPDMHELIVPVSGRIQTAIRGELLTGGAGKVLFYPMGAAHAERALDGQPLTMLYLGWNGSDALDDVPLLSLDVRGRIAECMRWMLELEPATDKESKETRLALLRVLIHELRHCRDARSDERVVRTLRHIAERLSEPHSVAELARIAGLSESAFARLFRRATGSAPMAFVRRERIRAAELLLGTTPHGMKQIAILVGFRDEFELSRVFRRVTGRPPGSVRRGARHS
jgi:AraC-like DNA-binding protein